MNIIFFGSDDFALAHLQTLHAAGYSIVACVTQPDRPKGRGMKMVVSPIKQFALDHQLPILQPVAFDETVISELKAFAPQLFIVIAYGRILPQLVLDLPSRGAINVHGSLLPRYRGAAPINWAILKGDKESGVTVIQMNAKMDAGAILMQEKVDIDEYETSLSLRQKIRAAGQKLLIETLTQIQNQRIIPTVQDELNVTIAPKLTKELGRIDWNQSAAEISRMVRGLLPWPGAYTFLNGKMLKILSGDVLPDNKDAARPGEVISMTANDFSVQTGSGILKVIRVHLADHKPMDVKDFLLGHKLEIGELLKK
ncbi:MAG: methionyl-tRNA formyltransferase [Candidatus Omnitrophica bacterium]|nr:methionyl-tRNA formyltransferase [Candidatus Omnitrophota bacterium]